MTPPPTTVTRFAVTLRFVEESVAVGGASFPQKERSQFSQENRPAGIRRLCPPHRWHRRQVPPHEQLTGSVVSPGWSHVVATSSGRGSCMESRHRESPPLRKP